MPPEETTTQLLVEIRDLQQKMLAEYSRVANEALALQREAFATQQRAVAQQVEAVGIQADAVAMQRKSVRLYRMVLLVAGPVLMFLVWKLLQLKI